MKVDPNLGGTHALSPEYLFNARRPLTLSAGLIGMDGRHLDVDEHVMDPGTYFRADGTFAPYPHTVTMHFLADPCTVNLYVVALPSTKLDGLSVPGTRHARAEGRTRRGRARASRAARVGRRRATPRR